MDQQFKEYMQSHLRSASSFEGCRSSTALKNILSEDLSFHEISMIEQFLDSLPLHVASQYVNSANHDGETLAHSCENVHALECLLKYRCDINARNNYGQTPLMYACITGNVEKITWLINCAANVNVGDYENKTALMYLCVMIRSAYIPGGESVCIIHNLIDTFVLKGANVMEKCNGEKMALDYVTDAQFLSKHTLALLVGDIVGDGDGGVRIMNLTRDDKITAHPSIAILASTQKKLAQKILYRVHIHHNCIKNIKHRAHNRSDLLSYLDDFIAEFQILVDATRYWGLDMVALQNAQPKLLSNIVMLCSVGFYLDAKMKEVIKVHGDIISEFSKFVI